MNAYFSPPSTTVHDCAKLYNQQVGHLSRLLCSGARFRCRRTYCCCTRYIVFPRRLDNDCFCQSTDTKGARTRRAVARTGGHFPHMIRIHIWCLADNIIYTHNHFCNEKPFFCLISALDYTRRLLAGTLLVHSSIVFRQCLTPWCLRFRLIPRRQSLQLGSRQRTSVP